MQDDTSVFVLATAKLVALMDLFDEVKAERAKLDAREAELNADWQAWYHIYEKEKPTSTEALVEAYVDASAPASPIAPLLAAPEEIENRIPVKNYGAKTLAVRQILSEAGVIGVSPKDLLAELEKRGIDVSESFAGNTLFRLRKKGEVFLNSDGKYVLSSFLPKEDFTFQAEDRGA